MKTIELTRTNGTKAQITFSYEANDTFSRPSVFSVKTAEVEISNASLMTESDVNLYKNALSDCAAVAGGRVDKERDLIACIRLDEVNYAKLQKEMESEYAAAAAAGAKAASR